VKCSDLHKGDYVILSKRCCEVLAVDTLDADTTHVKGRSFYTGDEIEAKLPPTQEMKLFGFTREDYTLVRLVSCACPATPSSDVYVTVVALCAGS
jgi:translation elongation factor P/translation initiation factor 5A